jgi:hypothetical protein
MILVAIRRLPLIVSIILVLLYGCMIFPIQLLLMIVDFILPHSDGNGLLVILEKAKSSHEE